MPRKLTTEKFIEKANKKHLNKYNYSLVIYENCSTKVKILCPIHGIFEQTPRMHLYGNSCPKCSHPSRKLSQEEFIEKAREIHGDNYDYSLVKYKGNKLKVKIICLKHGIFEQTPNHHMRGIGCSKCTTSHKLNSEEFIKKAKKTHGNKYDYSKINYINSQTTVSILCRKHGTFKQTPNSHLANHGCPKCNESKGEKKIRTFLEKNNISYVKEKRFDNCKNKYLLPFDFYIFHKNLLIEYDGIQHFKPINYFGGEKAFKQLKENDKIKNKFAKENNINLIRIPYNKLNCIDKILKDIL